jgi:hypothetical protein
MTSQELLQVAIENPKTSKVQQNTSVKRMLITLYMFGRTYPVMGGSRGNVGYIVHDYTNDVTSVLEKFKIPYRVGNDTQPKNLACNYIELI